jgi:FixJ family two-component response regulator
VPSAHIICLVDDDEAILTSLGRLLASDGLRAEKFTGPLDFLAHARVHPVQVAVIDLGLPVMTGFEVLSELRALPAPPEVIVMTGDIHGALREWALARGAFAFFRKPIEDKPFLAAVRAALKPAA